MSRYVIWTDDDNLEVFTGFDEGLCAFFLTIADGRICTGESGSYLFHNLDQPALQILKAVSAGGKPGQGGGERGAGRTTLRRFASSIQFSTWMRAQQNLGPLM